MTNERVGDGTAVAHPRVLPLLVNVPYRVHSPIGTSLAVLVCHARGAATRRPPTKQLNARRTEALCEATNPAPHCHAERQRSI